MAELPARLEDAELWRCVEVTVRDVLLPALADDADWARAAAVQLVGLARYAAQRPGPATEHERLRRRVEVLDRLGDNAYVRAHWRGGQDPVSADTAIAAILVAALGCRDDDAAAVHHELRPLLLQQLDDELVSTQSLVRAFRGQLDA